MRREGRRQGTFHQDKNDMMDLLEFHTLATIFLSRSYSNLGCLISDFMIQI